MMDKSDLIDVLESIDDDAVEPMLAYIREETTAPELSFSDWTTPLRLDQLRSAVADPSSPLTLEPQHQKNTPFAGKNVV